MAQTWQSKAAADVALRYWDVPLEDGDGVSAIATAASGVTVDSTESLGNGLVGVTLSAGTAGTGGSVTVTITTTEGLSLSETFYIAIRASTAQLQPTARDICKFALRKVVGNGNDPEASELDDALERLNDMTALWAMRGVDVGLSDPLAAGDTVTLPDGYIAALKFNLRVACHSHYDLPLDAYDATMASETYRALENALVVLGDVDMPQNLRRRWAYYTGVQ
jgi:hypothetical protein